MSRLPQITPDQANPQQADLYAAVEKKLGRVPNLLQVLGNSTAALRGYLEFSGALGTGNGLSAQQREIVALATAEANGCEYCLAAHCTIGKMAGLSPEAIDAARRGDGPNDADQALASFVGAVLRERGRVSDSELEAFRAAGFGDEAVTEVVAHVALNVFTNYFNNLAETDVDFPAAPLLEAEQPANAAHSTACGCDV